MSSQEENHLRTRFANLRGEDQTVAPPFGRTVAGAVFSRRRPVIPIALAAMPVLALVVMLAVRPHRSSEAMPRNLATWSSPTAFLLETPGKQLLNQTPRLGEPLLHEDRPK